MDEAADQDPIGPPSLQVLAAGSLRAPFAALAADWRRRSPLPVTISYANARDLAQRIEQGEPADVFASASPEHPRLFTPAGYSTSRVRSRLTGWWSPCPPTATPATFAYSRRRRVVW